MTTSIDVYVPPKNHRGQDCTCGGPAPGFPMHESFCGAREVEERGVFCCGWADGVCTGCPNRSERAA
ncbi:hypothetical protein [Rhodococcus sp. SJ-2]